jgi:hypothetical protein
VAAGLQRLRDLGGLRPRVRGHQVDERALARAARAEDERGATGEERREARMRVDALRLQRDLDDFGTHRRVRREARARSGERRQVALVEDDARRHAGIGGGDQRARELRFAERRLGGDDDEELVDVGRKRLRLPLVLAVEQVRARHDRLDHAFITRALPAHAVADDGNAPLAPDVAEDARAGAVLDDDVAAVRGDDQSVRMLSRGRRRGHRPWRRR